MSKGLKNMTPEDKKHAIARRLREDAKGLGTLAAEDAARKGAITPQERLALRPAQED